MQFESVFWKLELLKNSWKQVRLKVQSDAIWNIMFWKSWEKFKTKDAI